MEIHIGRNGERFGPYSIEEINVYLAAGTLLPSDLAWKDGMTDWLPVQQISSVVAATGSVATSVLPSQTVSIGNRKKILQGIAAVVGLLAIGAGIWVFFFRATEEKKQFSDNDGERDFTAQPQSGLALAGAQHSMNLWEIGLGDKAQYDGILTSGELGNLYLSKTRLVTLSACSSGRGSSTHGQGVSGMRQSLALAGVRNILMTHWPVSDRWTSEIMTDFYRANLNVERPAEALHLVQKRWMKKFRLEEGAKIAAQIAGPFFITTQGSQ